MNSREIVRRAIEFRTPPRLPFWQHQTDRAPQDVYDIWEMDRARRGWFFDTPGYDDWGCRWATAGTKNMGQVVEHPLADPDRLATYRPPDPSDSYYFERIEPRLNQAADRYVAVTCHFNLIERLHMLRGFAAAMEDLYLEPARADRLLDWILDFKLALLCELHHRFGRRIDGVFLTDDWATQQGPFISPSAFEKFFAARYRTLFEAIHGYGWHVILHSCGRINDVVPHLLEAGVDVLNAQQPRAYGLEAFGRRFRGKVCFLTTVDIQSTLPRGIEEEIREEARLLIQHWSTPQGGFVVFDYGDPAALDVAPRASDVMFDEFARQMHYWKPPAKAAT